MLGCSEESEARHWPALLATFVATALTHGLASSFGVFYVEWHRDFPDSSAVVGWLSSSLLAMLLCFMPIAGALVKRFGVRPVMVAGGVLSFSGLVIASFAHEIFVLFISIPFMTGIGFGMTYSGCTVHISECFHKHYALANGIMTTGASVGMVALPILFRLLIDQYGWRRAIMVIGSVQANVLVCALFLKPTPSRRAGDHKEPLSKCERNDKSVVGHRSRRSGGEAHLRRSRSLSQGSVDGSQFVEHTDKNGNPFGMSEVHVHFLSGTYDSEYVTSLDSPRRKPDRSAEGRSTEGTSVERRSFGMNIRSFVDDSGISLLWTNRVFASLMLMPITISAVYGITLPFLVARAKSAGVAEEEAVFLISVIGLSNIVSRLTHGKLVDANKVHPAYIQSMFLALPCVGGPLIAAVDSYLSLVICTVLIGLAAGAYIPLQFVLTRKIVGKERFPGGAGIGLVAVAIGNMASSLTGGYLYDVTGSYRAGFYLVGAMAGLSTVLMLGLHLMWTRLVPDDRWPKKTLT